MRPGSGALATVGAAALAAGAWGMWVEKNRFQLRHQVVPILDAGSEPIRILHLSDLHTAPWSRQLSSWVGALADTSPDLVVGTGDFLGHPDGLERLAEALTPLAGVPGVVVHGSNDRLAPRFKNPFGYLIRPSQVGEKPGTPMDFEGLLALYERLGWIDINNEATRMVLRGSRLELVGLGDAHHDEDDLAGLPATLEGLRESDESDDAHTSVTTIGVTHAPYRRVLDALVTQGAELIFAGHTHGGQVCLPGGHALTTNCDLPTDQASGLSRWGLGQRASYLHVSAGLGTSIYAPIRLFCPPEATLVTLVGEDIGYA